MYLIDTNIFLEILLEQEKSKECEELILRLNQIEEYFYVSSFTLHSIEVVMTKQNKTDALKEFLLDIISSRIIQIGTNAMEELNALKTMGKLNLDFDDALQTYICENHKLKIISFDRHFDKTSIKRLEPKEIA